MEIAAKNVSALTFAGARATVSAAYGPEMVIATYQVTPRIQVKDSPVVFVGYGINAPEKGWNDYAGLDVKGKTVGIQKGTAQEKQLEAYAEKLGGFDIKGYGSPDEAYADLAAGRLDDWVGDFHAGRAQGDLPPL